MDKIWSKAASRCSGEVRISGAKNAVLPILCAALLADEPVSISNVPRLHDVRTTLAPARRARCRASRPASDYAIRIDPRSVHSHVAPYELVKTMRASVLVLGPLLAQVRRGRSVAARRLRDRFAPRRPAHQGHAGARRRDQRRPRFHQGQREAPARRTRGVRHGQRRRDRERADGRHAGRGSHACSRTRRWSRRSSTSPTA